MGDGIGTQAAGTAPVVVIAFNRPDTTRRVLDRIRAAAPDRLLLIADGPRDDREQDAERCAAVRRELATVDWPCQVERRYSDVNLGCEPSVELGLDWAFELVPEAIVLEDDCLPHADFFPFCTELLGRFRDDERVWQIAGNSAAPAELVAPDGYGFAAIGSIWGWATWRRAWRAHRARHPRMHGARPAPAPTPVDISGSLLLSRPGRRYFADVQRDPDGRAFSWDSYWNLSTVGARALVAVPAGNLVGNIGGAGDGTHAGGLTEQPTHPMARPLRHPAAVELNPSLERELERVLVAHVGRLARVVARRLPKGRLRVVVRAVVARWRARAPRGGSHQRP